MSRRELAIVLILFMGLLAPLIPLGECALFPQDQTISIDSTHNDKWSTEIGRSIDSWLVHVLDPTYDVYSWVIFREVEINFWEPLHNATLRLYTGNTLTFDKDSMITIYGMKVDELQSVLPVGSTFAMSVPKTSHYVNLNTSQFYGPSAWWDIDVTTIIEELVRAHNWDGDGITGSETGDAIGFIIYGAKGHDVRYFTDYRSDPELSAQLRIRWNHQPPLIDPPSDDPEFIEQHGNYTIWRELGGLGYPLEPIEYTFRNGSGAPYLLEFGNIYNNASAIINSTLSLTAYNNPSSRNLVRVDNGTLFTVYEEDPALKEVWVSRSLDNGTTWDAEKHISYPLGGNNQVPSIAVDSKDYLHVVWIGETTVSIYYSFFNLSNPNNATWSAPIVISTAPCISQQLFPAIAIDSNDFIHVVWKGRTNAHPTNSQIIYANYTTSWSTPLRISTMAGMEDDYQENPAIAIDSENHIHVAFLGQVLANDQVYYVGKDIAWGTPVRISTLPNMHNYPTGMPSISVESNDVIHVVFAGKGDPYLGKYSIYETNYTDSWSTPYRVSTTPSMDLYDQRFPTIAIDEDDIIHVVWDGLISGIGADLIGWHSNETSGIWSAPNIVQINGNLQFLNLRWARWPVSSLGSYFNADPNGTVVQGPFDTLQEAQDCIDSKDTDPMDPDPPGWVTEGPFTRFKMRLYFLLIGYFAVWGPIWFLCWKRPSGYYVGVAFIIIVMGVGLLLQVPNV